MGQALLVAVEVGARSRSFSPITPFIGVRISWLIVARNSDFWRVASRAASRASASAALVRSRSSTCCTCAADDSATSRHPSRLMLVVELVKTTTAATSTSAIRVLAILTSPGVEWPSYCISRLR